MRMAYSFLPSLSHAAIAIATGIADQLVDAKRTARRIRYRSCSVLLEYDS